MTAEVVLTVSQISDSISKLLRRTYKEVWVSGEITGVKLQQSGHLYFSLKDEKATIRAIIWSKTAKSVGLDIQELKNGDHIQVLGDISSYQSSFQINVIQVKKLGLGALFEAYIRLKEKLEKEGLFALEHKKELPLFPRTVGIVTSPNAAALKDVITTFSRRAPHIRLILYPAAVQGKGAENEIARAIQIANDRQEVDLLIVCRGGGSLEDLWCFNEEIVSRALFDCSIPTISGVGHEIDYTLVDFVADIRAATPTGAAEMASRATKDWLEELEGLALSLQAGMTNQLQNLSQALDLASQRLLSPKSMIEKSQAELKNYVNVLSHFKDQTLMKTRHELIQTRDKLRFLRPNVLPHKTELSQYAQKLYQGMQRLLKEQQQQLQTVETQLSLLNPQEILNRGFAIIRTQRGKIVRAPNQLSTTTPMSLTLAKGAVKVTLSSIQEEFD